jgi:hypothetical protein
MSKMATYKAWEDEIKTMTTPNVIRCYDALVALQTWDFFSAEYSDIKILQTMLKCELKHNRPDSDLYKEARQ